jgi:hypothetical protein
MFAKKKQNRTEENKTRRTIQPTAGNLDPIGPFSNANDISERVCHACVEASKQGGDERRTVDVTDGGHTYIVLKSRRCRE